MIQVVDLEYTYPGSSEQTIKGLSFDVKDGEIFGFLGPSGAGKSTTQKIAIGILRGYQGSVQIFGNEVAKLGRDFYERIGVSFEFPNLYSKFTALENLQFFASLYSGKTADPLELLDMVDLAKDAHLLVSEYSKGMKMRLNFCRALLHQPKLLFLDEPTSGLDPVNAKRIKTIIREQQKKGTTIFLTTHNMTVADELCDRVAFLVDGEIALIDSPRTLKLRRGKKQVIVEYQVDGKTQSETFPLRGLKNNRGFLDILNTHEIETMHTQEASLEDIFIEVTGRQLI